MHFACFCAREYAVNMFPGTGRIKDMFQLMQNKKINPKPQFQQLELCGLPCKDDES